MITSIDSSILLWLQGIRVAVLTPILVFITHLQDHGMLAIAVTLILMCIPKTRRTGVICAISMVIGLIITNLILKNWVARVRPYEVVEGLELIIERQHDFSFPSGHATNSLACAWVIWREMDKRFGIPALILAFLICFSRPFVGVHYPTDVLAGIVIGIASAEWARVIVRALRRRFPAFKKFTAKRK